MSDIWHTGKENPKEDSYIVVKYNTGRCTVIYEFECTLVRDNIEKWAYFEDLLTLETELDRKTKSLEQSEICCTEWEKQALDYKAENIALSGDLERTRKALDLAKDTLYWYDDNYDSVVAQETINEITALEQKDK